MKWGSQVIQKTEEWISENGLMEYGGARLSDFIRAIDVNDKTYRRWLDEKPEFKDAIDKGKAEFKARLTTDLAASLAMVAKGYEREETEKEFKPDPKNPEKPIQTKFKKKKVWYQPNVGAAIFLLTNLDPENYQNRRSGDFIIRTGDEKQMTIDEINKEIERLSKLDEKDAE